MIRRPPRSTRTDTLFPYTTLFRASHYGFNAGVPKTLIQYLIRWAVSSHQFDAETDRILEAILATRISPELVPAGEDGEMQSTEDRIGPYEQIGRAHV